MSLRTLCLPLLLLAALIPTPAHALGEILGETKEQLKLQYDITVHDHGNGCVTIVFTLADEGRLKPLDDVDLSIPALEKDKSGGYSMDLSVQLNLKPSPTGQQTAHFELHKDLAARAQITLTTTTFDNKQLVMTRYHHIIPLAKHLNNAVATPEKHAAPAPPASEPKKD